MPYKDLRSKQAKQSNIISSNNASFKKFQEKYSPIVKKIQSYTIKNKAIYLSNIYKTTRIKIYNNYIIPFYGEIEKEIKFIKKEKIKKSHDDNWNFVKKWMIEKGCDCGEKNISKLSFHHLDPNEKENHIRMLCKYNLKKVKEELKKGVVKCKNCHTTIHNGDIEEREKCLINQYLKSSIKKRTIKRNKLLIWELKKSLYCVKCRASDPVILLFHHIDSKLKHKKISIMYRSGRDTINQEIAKTICLCHNCHEDFHYEYGRKTNKQQLEEYIGKKVIPIDIDIRSYLPIIEQNISQFNDPLLIT